MAPEHGWVSFLTSTDEDGYSKDFAIKSQNLCSADGLLSRSQPVIAFPHLHDPPVTDGYSRQEKAKSCHAFIVAVSRHAIYE